MLLKPVRTPSGKILFKLRPGQLAIGIAVLVVMSVLTSLSFAASQSQETTRETILAEESDSSALIFIQRESFALILQIENYMVGQSTQEDLLIARSTLAQRLNVITSTGESTYSVAGEGFRSILRDLDALLVLDKDLVANDELRAAASAFLSETKLLIDVFQEISRKNVKKAVEERAMVDLLQGGLSLLALVLGFLLFFWVVRDLASGFRMAYRELNQQSDSINQAEKDFLAIQELDERIASWNRRVSSGDDLATILREVKAELATRSEYSEVAVGTAGELEIDLFHKFSMQDSDARRALEPRLRQLIADIQRQSEAKQELEWERNHDGLTQILNRRGISQELAQKINSSHFTSFMSFDIDLDDFTGFNNAMGQEVGDRLLIEVANRLSSLDIKGVISARIAADEYGLIVPIGNSSIEELLAKVDAAIRYNSTILPEAFQVSSSLGFHVVEQGESADEVAAKTAAALKAAKADGQQGTSQQYCPAEHGHLLTEYLEQVAFRNALLSGNVVPYLQPIVDLTTREIVGYEALARWNTEDQGVLTPDRFMSLAAQGGLIDELFDIILEHAARNWNRFTKDKAGQYVSVNVDPRTLQVFDFAARVTREILRFKLDPRSLVLEITEESLADDSRNSQLEALRRLGVRIALDDFGTGYSSLSQLSVLPIDILKVDRSFISQGVDGPAGDMLKTIKQMATSANLRVIIEGIETEGMASAITDFGFEFGQGYLFGKPKDLLAH